MWFFFFSRSHLTNAGNRTRQNSPDTRVSSKHSAAPTSKGAPSANITRASSASSSDAPAPPLQHFHSPLLSRRTELDQLTSRALSVQWLFVCSVWHTHCDWRLFFCLFVFLWHGHDLECLLSTTIFPPFFVTGEFFTMHRPCLPATYRDRLLSLIAEGRVRFEITALEANVRSEFEYNRGEELNRSPSKQCIRTRWRDFPPKRYYRFIILSSLLSHMRVRLSTVIWDVFFFFCIQV